MSGSAPDRAGGAADARHGRSGRLYLLFTLGQDRYALPAAEIVEVLAVPSLKRLPEAPLWVAGILSHRGRPVPVIDLAARHAGRPAARRNSTRLAIVRYTAEETGIGLPMAGQETAWQPLGLILEQATETRRLADDGFAGYGLAPGSAGYLGPVQLAEGQEQDDGETGTGSLVQRIEVSGLLTADIREMLYPRIPEGA